VTLYCSGGACAGARRRPAFERHACVSFHDDYGGRTSPRTLKGSNTGAKWRTMSKLMVFIGATAGGWIGWFAAERFAS
jgi:hypothetical protein